MCIIHTHIHANEDFSVYDVRVKMNCMNVCMYVCMLLCMYEGLNAMTKDSTVLSLDAYGGAYSARHAATLDHGTSHVRLGCSTVIIVFL
jgi:hypothetical protein